MNLIIVESPTKAKTIASFLGPNFKTISTFGHLRDLPKTKLGIDVDKNFEPNYVIPAKAKIHVKEIVDLAKKADMIYYATDEDREGEAISWHLDQLLTNKYDIDAPKKRITFHEVTREAIQESLEQGRDIDLFLVDAQQTRRILDRLVGYKLSPFLWKKIRQGLSAGRVQSAAVRLIIDREREIKDFKSQEYWSIEGNFNHNNDEQTQVTASLDQVNNEKIKKFSFKTESDVSKISVKLNALAYSISSIVSTDLKKRAPTPYKTSTLQQDAHNKLGFSSKQTMVIAQQLYEGVELGAQGSLGLITYMRTDSLNISNKFIDQVKKFLKDKYGSSYSLNKKRIFKNSNKTAQEAHEAIHPTNPHLEPDSVKEFLDPRQYKLYKLIWERTIASLMPDAIITQNKLEILGSNKTDSAVFQAIAQQVKFDGFLKVYPIKIEEKNLPKLDLNAQLILRELLPKQHFTEPPPRYTDASLVKELEKKGIGRPSTYAPIIETIQKRKYIERDEHKKFLPTEIGSLVNDMLEKHFPNIVDYQFTAKLEDELDAIAHQRLDWHQIVANFYQPFAETLEQKYTEVEKVKIDGQVTDRPCPDCHGANLIIKEGRYGKFLACPTFPKCKYTEPLPPAADAPQLTAPSCPDCHEDMVLKEGRFGQFWACPNYPKCRQTMKIEQKIAQKCPTCKSGDVVVKRTKKGRIFYGCSAYPQCNFASWKKPELINENEMSG